MSSEGYTTTQETVKPLRATNPVIPEKRLKLEPNTTMSYWMHTFPDGEVRRWTGASRCLCGECRELFNSVGAFEKHRQFGACNLEVMFINSSDYFVTNLMPEGFEYPDA